MIKKFILLTSLIFMSACASTADYGSSSESGIKIYHTGLASIESRNSEAAAHCKRFNKKAVFVRASKIPLYDEYRCE